MPNSPVWSTASNLNTARFELAGCGNIIDALAFGGLTAATGYIATSEKWSGSSWSTTSSLNTAKSHLAACGNTTDALAFGGYNGSQISVTERWNSATWTTTGASGVLSPARSRLAGCGNTDGALAFGGCTNAPTGSTGSVNISNKWSGTAWSTTTVLLSSKYWLAGCGIVSDALAIGGNTGGTSMATTEKWNGSSWATTSTLNTPKEQLGCFGFTGAALMFGGIQQGSSVSAVTEKWNGSSWLVTSSLNQARQNFSGGGNTSNGLSFGGTTGARVATTEKWSGGVLYVSDYSAPEIDNGDSSSSDVIDWSLGDYQKIRLVGNCVVTFKVPNSNNRLLILKITQGSSGGYTVTFPDEVLLCSSYSTLSTVAGRIDIMELYFDGTYYWGSIYQNYT